MKKINRVKKSKDFDRIIHSTRPYKYKDYIIYVEKTSSGPYHFGLSVGKKIGNAVVRNRIKRQLRSIIDENIYENSFNCIIIVGKGILKCDYQTMHDNLITALQSLKLIKEK